MIERIAMIEHIHGAFPGAFSLGQKLNEVIEAVNGLREPRQVVSFDHMTDEQKEAFYAIGRSVVADITEPSRINVFQVNKDKRMIELFNLDIAMLEAIVHHVNAEIDRRADA